MPDPSKSCQHEDFHADVAVNRLTDSGRFSAEVKIHCVHCLKDFKFLGLKSGLDLSGASVSVDGTEARLAIAPVGEKPRTGDIRGFTITDFIFEAKRALIRAGIPEDGDVSPSKVAIPMSLTVVGRDLRALIEFVSGGSIR